MRIFVSSTVYDLIDVRDEIETDLRSVGLCPVMSDSLFDGFEISNNMNSLECCLNNVRNSDAFLLILSQRYGPSLKAVGYDDISATHLEYLEAKKLSIPIYVYLRDRLAADYTVWKKQKDVKDINLPWVTQKDYGLFSLIDQHCKIKDKVTGNWYQTYSSSVDLKMLIRKDLHKQIGKNQIEHLIRENKIPLFHGEIEFEQLPYNAEHEGMVNIKLVNFGTVPAYKVKMAYGAQEGELHPLIAPGKDIFKVLLIKGSIREEKNISLIYFDSFGNKHHDKFIVSFSGYPTNSIIHSICHKEHYVTYGNEMPITIKE
jgi:hypothetical protein